MYEAGVQGFKTSAARAAALIRKHLRANGINASVRSRVFSMGSSVDVGVRQDVLPATMRKIEAYCDQYQYGHFDGMDDSYRMSNCREDIPQAKYVHVSFHFSDALRQDVRNWLAERGIDPDAYNGGDPVWMTLNGSLSLSREFWTARKPRMRVAA